MPNGEAADMEMPEKSSSEGEPQGASFSGGEAALMGTLSDPLNKHIYKLCVGTRVCQTCCAVFPLEN